VYPAREPSEVHLQFIGGAKRERRRSTRRIRIGRQPINGPSIYSGFCDENENN